MEEEYVEGVMLEHVVKLEETNFYEIVVQAANGTLFNAGITEGIRIGKYKPLSVSKELKNTKSLLWIGCLLIIAVYHLLLYLFRKKNITALFFGLFCMLMAFKIISFGQHYLYEYYKTVLMIDFNWQTKLYYIFTFLLLPPGLYYVGSLYPKYSWNKSVKWFSAIIIAFVLFVILTPVQVFFPTIRYFQALILMSVVYLVVVLIRAMLNKEKEAIFQLIGICSMIFSVVNDILHTVDIQLTSNHDLMPIAFGVFLSMQIYIVARRYSNAFVEVEDLSMNLEKKVNERTHQLNEQKEILEEKNKEITDSINYAKRIQSAILPPDKLAKECLPDSFVLYKPKDIVAGDFYWLEQLGNGVLFAAADCTGHGVPGAMVSVVCNNALNRCVREYGLTITGEILDKTRDIVIQEFEKAEEEVKDGMDIAMCYLEGNSLSYSGANNPLWIARNGEILETKATKQPIGKYGEPKPFQTNQIDLQKGDVIYIFTDGYVDQFGGEKGKKFKAKAFRELLLSLQEKTMREQQKLIDDAFEIWRGEEEQVDDVCVIGVRI